MNDKKNIIFICTGNICRSPMAEYLMKSHLPSASTWQVSSAGLGAFDGAPPSEYGVKVMKEFGIDIRRHKSRRFDENMAKSSDLIVTMTRNQAEEIRSRHPFAAENVYVLKSFSPLRNHQDDDDLIDPIGMSEDVYRAVRDQIDVALSGLLSFVEAIEQK